MIPTGKTPWYKQIFFYLLFLPILAFGMPFILKAQDDQRRKRKKLRYFSPEIKEGLFSSSITWHEREKPLTDEQLKKLL